MESQEKWLTHPTTNVTVNCQLSSALYYKCDCQLSTVNCHQHPTTNVTIKKNVFCIH
ncbi:hypothetical protein [Microcoleus sp. CAWBG58]|uniref:hypothetical protein n=1 Tax=Microcoleus sp. CAWBG58 TaxID=2841651 RepID=UPI0025D668B8|nr:hypothetical protein [Microcoleus sp. CAWBG58]